MNETNIYFNSKYINIKQKLFILHINIRSLKQYSDKIKLLINN